LKSNSGNVPTDEQHKGKQRSDSAEPDSGGIPKNSVLHKTMQEWLLEKPIFSVRQKGDTPAFACQHAAIAPLPCSNL